MARTWTLVLAASGLVCAIAVLVSTVRPPAPAAVDTAAAVQAHLAHDPAAWVGRTVWVRGVAWRCLGWAYGPCLVRSPLLSDSGGDTVLALAPQPATLLLALVHAIPLVGHLLPPWQAPRWGVLASYRVQIRAVPLVSCTYWPCYAAALLDATPDTPPEG